MYSEANMQDKTYLPALLDSRSRKTYAPDKVKRVHRSGDDWDDESIRRYILCILRIRFLLGHKAYNPTRKFKLGILVDLKA